MSPAIEAIAAVILVALVVGILLRLQGGGPVVRVEEIVLPGPPCRATLRLSEDATEFSAPVEADVIPSPRTVERLNAAAGGAVTIRVSEGRLIVRAPRRLEGEAQLKFVVHCYQLLSHL